MYICILVSIYICRYKIYIHLYTYTYIYGRRNVFVIRHAHNRQRLLALEKRKFGFGLAGHNTKPAAERRAASESNIQTEPK